MAAFFPLTRFVRTLTTNFVTINQYIWKKNEYLYNTAISISREKMKKFNKGFEHLNFEIVNLEKKR